MLWVSDDFRERQKKCMEDMFTSGTGSMMITEADMEHVRIEVCRPDPP